MRQETELQRLAAARPAVLDRTQNIVSTAEQERILRRILEAPRGQPTPRRAAGERPWPQRWRSYRITARTSIAAASVAATILAGGALAINDSRPHAAPIGTSGGRAVTVSAKIVLARSIRVLSQVGDAVEYSHVTGSLNGQPYTSDLWVYRAAERQRLTGPGSTDTEGWQAISGGTVTRGFIDHASRTWTRYTSPADAAWREIARTPAPVLEARFLKSVLDSGRWTATGRVVLQGQEALVIKITEAFPGKPGVMPDTRRQHRRTRTRRPSLAVPAGPLIDVAPSLTPAQVAHAIAHGQTTFTSTGTFTRTLYISAKTYLPIMETDVTHLTSQGVPDSAAEQTATSTFQWLPADPASLALVKPPAVPAGYTRVQPNGQ